MLRRSVPASAGWARRGGIVAGFCAVLLTSAPASAQLQSITLSLSSQTVTLAAPTATNYNAGYTAAGSLNYTVTTNRLLNIVIRLTIRASPNAPAVEWASAAGGPWTQLTGTQATVRTETIGPLAGGFSGTLYFRIPLAWTTDPPGNQTLSGIEIRITP